MSDLSDIVLSQMTGKQAQKTAYCDSFDRDFFESDGVLNANWVSEDADRDSYEYIVLWYDAEPNAFLGANSPSCYALGIKEAND